MNTKSSDKNEYMLSRKHTSRSHYPLDLLHVEQLGGQAAVHAQNLLVHDRRHRKAVETVCERLPQLNIVSPFACKSERERCKSG